MSSIALRDGVRIAYQEFGAAAGKKIIGLHGWLDNSNTYTLLGPYLAAKGYHLVALDTVGHGRSSHLSVDSQYTTDKTVAYLHEVVESLGWEKPHIMGHSMGAGIALAYAGVFPEKVDKLVMIEGLGAYTSSAAKGCKNLRRAIEALQKADLLAAKLGTRSKVYASFKDAVDARVRVVSSYPGNQTLSEEAATWLLERNTNPVGTSGAVQFAYDPKLLLPSHMYLTDEHIMSFVEGVTSKSLLVSAELGWPLAEGDSVTAYQDRITCLTSKGLLTHAHMHGSHHLHLDPETADSVNKIVGDFLDAP